MDFQNFENKENPQFRVAIFKKKNIILELGTFDRDLGGNLVKIEDVEYRVPATKWLASCYRVTAKKKEEQVRMI